MFARLSTRLVLVTLAIAPSNANAQQTTERVEPRATRDVENKLDIILRKLEQIEQKLERLERSTPAETRAERIRKDIPAILPLLDAIRNSPKRVPTNVDEGMLIDAMERRQDAERASANPWLLPDELNRGSRRSHTIFPIHPDREP